MTTADIIFAQVKALPEPLAREVLDFIGYLKERTGRSELHDLMLAQEHSLREVWDTPEDEVWNDV